MAPLPHGRPHGRAGLEDDGGQRGAAGGWGGELRRVISPKLLLFFIISDIIGAGVFAITGDVAAQVGGVAWLPFLVALAVVVVIPPGDILDPVNPDAGILLDVVRVGAPGLPIDDVFPFLTICAVGNTALINMVMASRRWPGPPGCCWSSSPS